MFPSAGAPFRDAGVGMDRATAGHMSRLCGFENIVDPEKGSASSVCRAPRCRSICNHRK